ncbi:MAG: thiol peroxidase [candidate division KSB1 bacterium]|nr:thiol peroxidase [candidate division KSB1 bacterium]MDZ7302572.1 thiol peroxidase [candidate division KSB1 bacterium]MDZ7311587.1 thiol peroxidase [candidate division KSB1 bacterium]
MPGERKESYNFRNNAVHLVGPEIKVGDQAPPFTVLTQDFTRASLDALKGKPTVIASVPSLDTSVCDLETKRFNEEAAKLGDKVNFVTISCDLPFGQKRWCGMSNVDKVHVFSDQPDRLFGQSYGVFVKETGFLWRAVFVLDKDGIVRYVEYVPEMGQQPNYDKILEAVKKLI